MSRHTSSLWVVKNIKPEPTRPLSMNLYLVFALNEGVDTTCVMSHATSKNPHNICAILDKYYLIDAFLLAQCQTLVMLVRSKYYNINLLFIGKGGILPPILKNIFALRHHWIFQSIHFKR